MFRLLTLLAGLTLVTFLFTMSQNYVGDMFQEDSKSANANVLTTEIQQIRSAVRLYRNQESEPPTIKSGQEGTNSGNDLLAEGYMNDWPDGWTVKSGSNTIVKESLSGQDEKICEALRKQLNADLDGGDPPSCSDGSYSSYPCCTP